jgi:hypothetical protein
MLQTLVNRSAPLFPQIHGIITENDQTIMQTNSDHFLTIETNVEDFRVTCIRGGLTCSDHFDEQPGMNPTRQIRQCHGNEF